jgi:hypothetical protein
MKKRTIKYLILIISIILLSLSIGCFQAPREGAEPLPDRL